MENIKFKEKEETRKVIIGKCPFCEKQVRGSTKEQVYWNISLHVKQKHKGDPYAESFIEQFEEQGKIPKTKSEESPKS